MGKTNKAEMFTLIGEGMQAAAPFYRNIIQSVFEENNMEGRDWYLSALAHSQEPTLLTQARYRAMHPYAHTDRISTMFAETADKGFLEKVGEEGYRLTEAGRKGAAAFHDKAQAALEAVDIDVDDLNALLGRVVQAISNALEPVEKPHFAGCRTTDTGTLKGLARTDQYLTDLYRFRDDVHPAAWRTQEDHGIVWEAFSMIWRKQFADIQERVEQRGYPAEKLDKITASLSERGWIEADGDGYKVTEAGATLRQNVEDETDRLFFAPWKAVLSAEEWQQVADLLTALNTTLNQMAEALPDAEAIA